MEVSKVKRRRKKKEGKIEVREAKRSVEKEEKKVGKNWREVSMGLRAEK
jgi:hypothetical protein